jgi:hypothetical protein
MIAPQSGLQVLKFQLRGLDRLPEKIVTISILVP